MENRHLNRQLKFIPNNSELENDSPFFMVCAEIYMQIISYLSNNDTSNLGMSCKFFYYFLNDLWHAQFQHDFPEEYRYAQDNLNIAGTDWKAYYAKMNETVCAPAQSFSPALLLARRGDLAGLKAFFKKHPELCAPIAETDEDGKPVYVNSLLMKMDCYGKTLADIARMQDNQQILDFLYNTFISAPYVFNMPSYVTDRCNFILAIHCKQSDQTLQAMARARHYDLDASIKILEAAARYCDGIMFETIRTYIPTSSMYELFLTSVYYTAVIYKNFEVINLLDAYNFSIQMTTGYKNIYHKSHPYTGLNLIQILCMMGAEDQLKNNLAKLAKANEWDRYLNYCRYVLMSPDKGEAPLVIAAQKGHVELLKLLLSEDFSEFSNCHRYPALQAAVKFGQFDAVRYLYKRINFNKFEINLYKLIYDAAKLGHQEITEYFLTALSRPFPIAKLNQVLLHAMAHCNQQWLTKLMLRGADINAIIDGMPILHHYIKKNSAQPVTMLLANDVNVDQLYNNQNAFEYAAQIGADAALGALLPQIKNQPFILNPLLYKALMTTSPLPMDSKHRTIKLLLQSGADITTCLKNDYFLSTAIKNLIEAGVKDFSHPRQNDLRQQIFDYLIQLNYRITQGEHFTTWFGPANVEFVEAAYVLLSVVIEARPFHALHAVLDVIVQENKLKSFLYAYLQTHGEALEKAIVSYIIEANEKVNEKVPEQQSLGFFGFNIACPTCCSPQAKVLRNKEALELLLFTVLKLKINPANTALLKKLTAYAAEFNTPRLNPLYLQCIAYAEGHLNVPQNKHSRMGQGR